MGKFHHWKSFRADLGPPLGRLDHWGNPTVGRAAEPTGFIVGKARLSWRKHHHWSGLRVYRLQASPLGNFDHGKGIIIGKASVPQLGPPLRRFHQRKSIRAERVHHWKAPTPLPPPIPTPPNPLSNKAPPSQRLRSRTGQPCGNFDHCEGSNIGEESSSRLVHYCKSSTNEKATQNRVFRSSGSIDRWDGLRSRIRICILNPNHRCSDTPNRSRKQKLETAVQNPKRVDGRRRVFCFFDWEGSAQFRRLVSLGGGWKQFKKSVLKTIYTNLNRLRLQSQSTRNRPVHSAVSSHRKHDHRRLQTWTSLPWISARPAEPWWHH